MDLKIKDFQNWTPIRVYPRDGQVFVDWCFLGEKRFTESFHDMTIEMRLRAPFNSLFHHQTPIEFLGEMYEESKGAAPKGFIFHVSRCGSTLVSQMFAALRKNIVISEASVIDKIIRPDACFPPVSDEQKIIWLRWMFNALAQKRFAEEENFFVKFDSWSVLDLPLIERAFPDVPWIFLYRNPIEVIVSNLRQPGAQMIPGAISNIFPDLNLFEILQYSTEERFARTVAAFCRAGLKNAESSNAMLVNYAQLPTAVTEEICRHFSVEFTAEEIETMKSATKFHAKTPQFEFQPDVETKRNEASKAATHFAETLVDPLYKELENRRLQVFV